MKKKNYSHNVIRLRKGKKIIEQNYWIIAILNKRKTSSEKIVYRLGYIQLGNNCILSIDYNRLGYLLNKGFVLKKNVKKLIALVVFFYNKKNG
jgi:hypothetical protein